MTNDELLRRIAATLKEEIGPAVSVEYPKTQAFMAGVVLQKLGLQLGLERAHEATEAAETDALIKELETMAGTTVLPGLVAAALEEFSRTRDKTTLCRLIEALYASHGDLGQERFAQMLGRVRVTLRASIDRQVEYAA